MTGQSLIQLEIPPEPIHRTIEPYLDTQCVRSLLLIISIDSNLIMFFSQEYNQTNDSCFKLYTDLQPLQEDQHIEPWEIIITNEAKTNMIRIYRDREYQIDVTSRFTANSYTLTRDEAIRLSYSLQELFETTNDIECVSDTTLECNFYSPTDIDLDFTARERCYKRIV
jgi:hypothetical protein